MEAASSRPLERHAGTPRRILVGLHGRPERLVDRSSREYAAEPGNTGLRVVRLRPLRLVPPLNGGMLPFWRLVTRLLGLPPYGRALRGVADRLLGVACVLLQRHTLFDPRHGTSAAPSPITDRHPLVRSQPPSLRPDPPSAERRAQALSRRPRSGTGASRGASVLDSASTTLHSRVRESCALPKKHQKTLTPTSH